MADQRSAAKIRRAGAGGGAGRPWWRERSTRPRPRSRSREPGLSNVIYPGSSSLPCDRCPAVGADCCCGADIRVNSARRPRVNARILAAVPADSGAALWWSAHRHTLDRRCCPAGEPPDRVAALVEQSTTGRANMAMKDPVMDVAVEPEPSTPVLAVQQAARVLRARRHRPRRRRRAAGRHDRGRSPCWATARTRPDAVRPRPRAGFAGRAPGEPRCSGRTAGHLLFVAGAQRRGARADRHAGRSTAPLAMPPPSWPWPSLYRAQEALAAAELCKLAGLLPAAILAPATGARARRRDPGRGRAPSWPIAACRPRRSSR